MEDKKLEGVYKEYAELLKKRKLLVDRFDELEKLEKKLDENKEISTTTRLKNKKKLLEEYQKVQKLFTQLNTQAKELATKLGLEE